MKFKEFLMQRGDKHPRKLLKEEVAELQSALENEQKLNQILQCAVYEPLVPLPCLSCPCSVLPLQVQMLLTELAIVEEEIICLEKIVEDLKHCIYQERKQQKLLGWQHPQWWQREQMSFICNLGNPKQQREVKQSESLPGTDIRSPKLIQGTTPESAFESQHYTKTNVVQEAQTSRSCNTDHAFQRHHDELISINTPNRLSEELIKSLINIFCKLQRASKQLGCETITVPKLSISCISSKSFMTRTSFNCKHLHASEDPMQALDPYGTLLDIDGATRDIGLYSKCIHLTRRSLDMTRMNLCIPDIAKLQFLFQNLCNIEVRFLTYKQKLAFWINIYNATIMHAFLQNGIPPSSDKLLTFLNKAAVNVGGIVLNALAIEHFILRHSSNINGHTDEKETLLRHAYGLGYPEPNVTFALCRGNWSSPAMRVYTAENVANELEKAKVEYLQASIFVTSKNIFMPKLLHLHMKDFADDIVSFLEWVYSQLPRSGSLKKSIMACLNGNAKTRIEKMVEIRPYEAEFRFLLPC